MCSAVYLEREPQVKDGYYKTNETVEVRLQHVLKIGIKLYKVIDSKILPTGLRRKNDIIKNGLYKIRSDDIEDIFKEIRCREALEHIEEYNVISDDEINSNFDMDNDDDISDESDAVMDDIFEIHDPPTFSSIEGRFGDAKSTSLFWVLLLIGKY